MTRPARHSVFTVITDVTPGKETRLEALLDAIAQDPDALFGVFPAVHFASFVLFSNTLELPMSKLVLECSVDGSADDLLRELVRLRSSAIDPVYQCCDGYPEAVADGDEPRLRQQRYEYLRARRVRPQLYHVGTPYRSVPSIQYDRDLRSALDETVQRMTPDTLPGILAAAPTAVHEYWGWEAVKPWVVCLLGAVAAWLVPSLPHWQDVSEHGTRPVVVAIALVAARAALALVEILLGLAFGYWLWSTSSPELRAPARRWVAGSAGLFTATILVKMFLPHVRPWAAVGAVLLAVPLVVKAWIAYRRRDHVSTTAAAAGALLPALVSRAGEFADAVEAVVDRAGFWLWNWRWFFIAWAATWLPLCRFAPYPWRLTFALALFYGAEGAWLTVLAGWPTDGTDGRLRGWSGRAAAVVPVAALAGFVVVGGALCLHSPAWLLAFLVVVTFFALWSLPVPSPDGDPFRLARAHLATLVDQEDRDVQNHMAAVVSLKRDRWYRPVVLKSFLWILNAFFFRAVLPDFYKGKLFGILTVHFAQWVLIDDHNFLFLSNYDLSWNTYLDDFGAELGGGIQKIWGQGFHNPGTSDLGRFKDYARTTMVRTSVWYRAYPGLTVRQTWNNEHIRQALVPGADEGTMARVLRRFGAAPKTLADLSHARID